ncbi:MAG: inorganic phosphate transporter [Candidatus Omnitrophica bacterium]|nr:inorganic phosphate transporter [Candidatus Omnitrophota bacterium]
MSTDIAYVVFIVLIALGFDFINGFHDCANAISTVVSTRVLRPGQAVAWAAFWNFVAAWFFGLHVALTIGKGVIPPELVTPDVILGGLLGAIVWDLFTWAVGLPTSSSHALVGGFGGAACVSAGRWVVIGSGLRKIGLFIVVSPLLGFVLGYALFILTTWMVRRQTPFQVDRIFRTAQLASSGAYSLGHGTNDAQKTMGIIALLLYTTVWRDHLASFKAGHFPFWIVLICHAAMGLGTLLGGWRIIRTMGARITKLRPHGGACAELGAACSLFATAQLGIPVSTTHTITGAIVGVGASRRVSAVRWGVAAQVVWAWILTIPCSALVGAVSFLLIRTMGGWAASAVIALATFAVMRWLDVRAGRVSPTEITKGKVPITK